MNPALPETFGGSADLTGSNNTKTADLGVVRSYGSFTEMAQKEARRKEGIEAVAIVTPNHKHAPVAVEFQSMYRMIQ